MKTWHETMKNGIDSYNNYIGETDHKNLFVLYSQNRDSGLLTRNNFKNILKSLGGESQHVKVMNFKHWGYGWFELILIDSTNKDIFDKAEEIESCLLNYPVYNDSDYYKQLNDEINEFWGDLCLSQKIDYCKYAKVSIFQARYNLSEMDKNLYQYLEQLILE